MKQQRRKLFVQGLRVGKVQGRLAVEFFQIEPLSEKIVRFKRFKDELARTSWGPVESCRTCVRFSKNFQASRYRMNHIIQHSGLVREDDLVSVC